MKKSVIILIIVTIFTKTLGFIREMFLSYFYGISSISDAYRVSIIIPSFIFGFVSLGLTTVFIPMYNSVNKKLGEDGSIRFTNNIIFNLMFFIAIFYTVSTIFTKQLIRVFAYGFDVQTLDLTVKLTRISLLGMFLTGIVSILTGFLHIKRKYVVPIIAGIPLNLINIISIYISSKGNILILSIGTLFSLASQLIIIIPFVKKCGYKFSGKLEILNKDIRVMIKIALPVIIGSSVSQINLLVDKTIASGLRVGAISALGYSSKLFSFIYAIIINPIITILYPNMSKCVIDNDYDRLKLLLHEAIRIMIILIIPITIGVMLFSKEIIILLFGRGKFNFDAVAVTSYALFFYAISLLVLGLRNILSRVFYAMADTLIPTINTIIGLFLNIVLNIILSKVMGVGGLALSTSLSLTVTCFLMVYHVIKKIGRLDIRLISILFFKILIASLIMGVLAKISYNNLIKLLGCNFSLIITVILSIIVYLCIIYLMRINDVVIFFNIFKSKFIKDKLKRG